MILINNDRMLFAVTPWHRWTDWELLPRLTLCLCGYGSFNLYAGFLCLHCDILWMGPGACGEGPAAKRQLGLSESTESTEKKAMSDDRNDLAMAEEAAGDGPGPAADPNCGTCEYWAAPEPDDEWDSDAFGGDHDLENQLRASGVCLRAVYWQIWVGQPGLRPLFFFDGTSCSENLRTDRNHACREYRAAASEGAKA